jgi:hypothetical protein
VSQITQITSLQSSLPKNVPPSLTTKVKQAITPSPELKGVAKTGINHAGMVSVLSLTMVLAHYLRQNGLPFWADMTTLMDGALVLVPSVKTLDKHLISLKALFKPTTSFVGK